ncbi:very short patch repair endonuclease [Micromonospora sp. WMMD723]|uniref:very short patch repair endonuclease n=1 Tax=Micromonospora sp. WMMD723 TaxID=3403465 RepID=UPI003CFA32EC
MSEAASRLAYYRTVPRRRVELAPDDPRHGTTNGYGNLGCRCDLCREAHRRKHVRYMHEVRKSKSLSDTTASGHGTSYRYDVGCRCEECREAHNAKSRVTKKRIREKRAQRSVSSTPSLPPAPPPSAASASMRSNRSRDTGPEIRLRRALHARGHRYRVGMTVTVGSRRVRPDIVYTRRKIAVFVDGCFWHRCPQHGRAPSDPTGYWAAKFQRNVERDIAVTHALNSAGWQVLRIWEHVPLEESVAIVDAAFQNSARAGR